MIKATIADGRGDLYQWDVDRVLHITGAPNGSEVNFITRDDKPPITVLLNNGQVTVPNELLQVPRLFVKFFVYNDSHTLGDCRIRVIAQPKPDGYAASEDEILTWDKLFKECGYYTPSVSSDGTISWSKSKSTMPDISSVNIKGPKGDPATVTIRCWTESDV